MYMYTAAMSMGCCYLGMVVVLLPIIDRICEMISRCCFDE